MRFVPLREHLKGETKATRCGKRRLNLRLILFTMRLFLDILIKIVMTKKSANMELEINEFVNRFLRHDEL